MKIKKTTLKHKILIGKIKIKKKKTNKRMNVPQKTKNRNHFLLWVWGRCLCVLFKDILSSNKQQFWELKTIVTLATTLGENENEQHSTKNQFGGILQNFCSFQHVLQCGVGLESFYTDDVRQMIDGKSQKF